MAGKEFRTVLPQIRRLFSAGTNSGLSDGVLLHRYCSADDGTAFETLLGRHGAMVWSVCRSIVRDEPTAEDAFQAVFLILVRKARSIRVDDSLGAWLHAVAVRTARRARADAAKHRSREGAHSKSILSRVRNRVRIRGSRLFTKRSQSSRRGIGKRLSCVDSKAKPKSRPPARWLRRSNRPQEIGDRD